MALDGVEPLCVVSSVDSVVPENPACATTEECAAWGLEVDMALGSAERLGAKGWGAGGATSVECSGRLGIALNALPLAA